MNWVDLVVILLAIGAGVSGARAGMVTALASFIGVLLGAVLAVRIAPKLVEHYESPSTRVAVALGVVVLLVALGETLGVAFGRAVRDQLQNERLVQVESALGAVVQACAALAVCWLVALPMTTSSYTGLADSVRSSKILGTVDGVMPQGLRDLPNELTRLLDSSAFPTVLDPFDQTPITAVGPADPNLINSPVVRDAAPSILKVRGRASSCSRMLEGTAFVVAPNRMMTNAHVVAGTDRIRIETEDGDLNATVVRYDPGEDVAILAVPGLDAPVLPLETAPARNGTDVLVLGYPLDGPYKPSPGRIREEITLRGPDIYGGSTVERDVYTVRARVQSGNSGGPLVDTAGRVRGLVFGAAVDDSDTGFALTADEIVDDIAAAPTLTQRVSTGGCAD